MLLVIPYKLYNFYRINYGPSWLRSYSSWWNVSSLSWVWFVPMAKWTQHNLTL